MIILGPYSDDFTHNSLCQKKYSALDNLLPCGSARRLWTSPTDDASCSSRASAVELTVTQSKRETFITGNEKTMQN